MKAFDSKALAELMQQALQIRKVAGESIGHVVASLVQTSLRGVDSHGINLFPHYCRAVDAGRINARPDMLFTHPAPGVAILDGDHGFGHHAGATAMDRAIELGIKNGIGAVSVKNSTHFGAAAYFGLRAPVQDCLGFAFTNADALVKASGAKAAFFGTNPICFTAPLPGESPFCLDMATSMASWNKVKTHRRQKLPIPAHWAFDIDGQPVVNPDKARSLSPIGDYKGFGLGMMVDILCALLSGGPISKDILPMYQPPLDSRKRNISHYFMAIDISKFTEPPIFKQRLQSTIDLIRDLQPLLASDKVMAAGDPEKETLVKRKRAGIPVDDAQFDDFLSISADFSEALI